MLPHSAEVGPSGTLHVGGVDLLELASRFGTPLYVYDAEQLRRCCERYVNGLAQGNPPGKAVFASKSFPAIAMLQIALDSGMGIDVASGGELYLALAAGADPSEVYYHGNAKSLAEVDQGIEAGVGRFVVDNLDELHRLEERILTLKGPDARPQPILVRVTPGIEAHTHEFIKTGHEDSKFGFFVSDGSALAALERAARSPVLDPIGIHIHIGSQILDVEPFREAARIGLEFVAEVRRRLGLSIQEIDFGGGLGAKYLPTDDPPEIEEYTETLKKSVAECSADLGLDPPTLVVEPGRSIVANAGLTLYTVQSVKTTPAGRTYVAVDGGMSDNLRPMLYGAEYLAVSVTRLLEPHERRVTLAGKHCESGDIVVRAAALPSTTAPGDVVAVPATGAYGWAMASNYNGQPRPAVVFVERGEAEVVVERETYRDLARLQRPISRRNPPGLHAGERTGNP